VLDMGNFGSSLSMRGFVRMGSSLSVVGKTRLDGAVYFNDDDTYTTLSSSNLEFYVANYKVMTLEADGGILHGVWNHESTFSQSDRRLKRDIVPLQRTLRGLAPVAATQAKERHMQAIESATKAVKRDAAGDGAPGAGPDGALWLLRQLRPVSYSFKKGVESKFMRFGFLADDLESVVPSVVRTTSNQVLENQKAVVYQDLIALLAAAAQSQQLVLDQQQLVLDQLHLLLKEQNERQLKDNERQLGEMNELRAIVKEQQEMLTSLLKTEKAQ